MPAGSAASPSISLDSRLMDTMRQPVLLALGVLLCCAPGIASKSVSVKDLIAHADQYHQQTVSVVGKADELTTTRGPRNLPFYTFMLRDHDAANESVTVIMQGKPELSNGDQVLVYGVFIKTRKAGRSTITNRIEAIIIKQLHNHHEPLIGYDMGSASLAAHKSLPPQYLSLSSQCQG
jgi:hypothetical protein